MTRRREVQHGQVRRVRAGKNLFTVAGRSVAFTQGDSVCTVTGRHVGFVRDSWMYMTSGAVVGWFDGANFYEHSKGSWDALSN